MNKEELINTILSHICYTELVYQRINKKLETNYSKSKIESLISKTVLSADKIIHKGKNYYVYNYSLKIRITINSNNYRVITVDILKS